MDHWPMTRSDSERDALLQLKWSSESQVVMRIERTLRQGGNGTGAVLKRLRRIKRVNDRGVAACLSNRNAIGQAELRRAVDAFIQHGAAALFPTGAQRGGDFLLNQIRGRWAEDVLAGWVGGDLLFAAFGPSGAAMPGDEDHEEVVGNFRMIALLEGKRPDLLLYDRGTWLAWSQAIRSPSTSWPQRLLRSDDDNLVGEALAGIEVKSSTWHYGTRRSVGGGPLSVTVKAEEIEPLKRWQASYTRPILFVQVLFDEVYCMSFERMCHAIDQGFVNSHGDYRRDAGAGGKEFHRFLIDGAPFRCGLVRYPDQSRAVIRTLIGGSVIPYIEYAPAELLELDEAVLGRELSFRRE